MTYYTYKSDYDDGSLYSKKLKNYLFGNPCTYNPSVLVNASSTIAKCTSYSNRSLTNGVTAYLRYVNPQINDYMYGRVNFSQPQMDNLTLGVSLAGFYLMDAILTWNSEFSQMLNSFTSIKYALTCIACISILAIYLVCF